VNRLLGGTALTVDRHTRNVLGVPGGQPTSASDVASLGGYRIHATKDDIFDHPGVDASAIDQPLDGMRTEVGGVDFAQAALFSTDGGTDCFNDICFGHLNLAIVYL
jgi:hypothetical protein